MWSDDHDASLASHIDGLLDDALGDQEVVASRVDTFRVLHDRIVGTTRRALSSRARALNDAAPVNALPPELLCRVATHLSFGMRCYATLVCKQWLETLLGATALWQHVTISLRHAPWRWEASLAALLHRSRERALRLSVQCETPAYGGAIGSVSNVVRAQMHRIVELSMSLSPAATPFWISTLTAEAPVLETLRVQVHVSHATPAKQLPANLFSGCAPHLKTVLLTSVLVPDDPCAALTAVTSLTYDRIPELQPAHVSRLFVACPALAHLTITSRPHPSQTFPMLNDVVLESLHICDVPRVDALLAALPNARHVCRSFLFNPSPVSAVREMIVSSPTQLKTLDVCLCPATAAHTGAHTFAVLRLDDARMVAVDVIPHAVHVLLSEPAVVHALRHVGRLTIHERFCVPGPVPVLPSLRDLCITVEWDDQTTGSLLAHDAARWPPLTTRNLRTVTLMIKRRPHAVSVASIPPATLAHFISTTLGVPRRLDRLVLCGRALDPRTAEDGQLALCVKSVIVESPVPCCSGTGSGNGSGGGGGRGRPKGHWVWHFPHAEAVLM